MSIMKPSFIDSPFFFVDDEGWHLRDGAPDEVRKEFEEYMEYVKKLESRGISI